jgi:putative transposase
MQRVERHIIRNDPSIAHLCYLSKNLYNYCNYILRQLYFKNLSPLEQYTHLIKKFILSDKTCYSIDEYTLITHLAKTDQPDYRLLPPQTSQQIIKILYKNWKIFYKSIKHYRKNKSLFSGEPGIVKYKNKGNGKNVIVFTNQQVRLKRGFIHFVNDVLEPIKTNVTHIDQVRIVPQATCYVLEVVYTKEVKNVEVIPNTYLGIDIGVNNLATSTNNIGKVPFVINGRPLKSINQYFNKKKALLQSYVGNKSSKRILNLTFKRNNKVQDYLHKASRLIINYCVENKISEIIVGKSRNWKQSVNMCRKNNQNFVCIPFARFIAQVSYKAKEVGIKVSLTEESHTSKCSFLDLEEVCHHDHYRGKRVKRGLFRSFDGRLCNADVNGSYNIMRKVVPNAFSNNSNGIEGVGLHPVMVNIK